MTDWLRQERLKAAELYRSLPLPDRVRHAWRYTDPGVFQPPDPDAGGPGVFSLPAGHLPAGLTLMDLEQAAGASRELVRPRLGTASGEGKFDVLNRAAWRSGLLVHAAPGFETSEPVGIALRPETGDFGAFRILVLAQERARLSIAVDLANVPPEKAKLLNLAVEFFAEPDSELRCFLFQDLPSACRLYLSQHASVGDGARFESVTVSLGGGIIKADSGARLNGPGARSEFSGVILADGSRHLDHRTVHEHKARRTFGTFDYRAVVKDGARSIYTGMIRIEPGAAGCEAYQENRNLMLSPGARAESIPELEILDNDVDCAHGSATGPAEPEHIFYLMSRGLSQSEAVRAVAEGFVDKVASKLPPPFYARFKAGLARRLHPERGADA